MNGRSIVHNALANDPVLQDLGVTVMPNFGFDDPPRSPFIVLRWGNDGIRGGVRRGPRTLEVWANIPTSISRDFDDVEAILKRVREVLEPIEQMSDFGEHVTCITYTGTGPDVEDPGYNTITRNAGFEILAR